MEMEQEMFGQIFKDDELEEELAALDALEAEEVGNLIPSAGAGLIYSNEPIR
jgi:hypothetical protein